MSGDETALPASPGASSCPGASSWLRGSRTRSYGSLVRSPLSPTHQRRLEHILQPGETLQGLALKYGVTMEQIKRANRLYTNESIFLKKSLWIPVMADLDDCTDSAEEDSKAGRAVTEKEDNDCKDITDLTPEDFLQRLDGLINQSKHAAVKSYQDAEKRISALEAACSSCMSDWRPLKRSQSVISPSKTPQHAALVTVPVTITKLTKKLREKEDEIFEL